MERLKGKDPLYIQHEGTVVDRGKFSHVMALTLNPTDNNEGLIRCITDRSGDVEERGNIDKSALYIVRSTDGLERYEIDRPLEIRSKDEIIEELMDDSLDFLGLEDPDLILDTETNLLHLYFTIPLISKTGSGHNIYLGHAVGKNLDSMEMTQPVLSPTGNLIGGAKEVSLAPLNSESIRLNLVESSDKIGETEYSTVRIGVCKDLGEQWEFGKTVIHPKHNGKPWCAEHASPGPLLPRGFIDVGKGKRLGILNGREESKRIGSKINFGIFSVGLFIYDYENGRVNLISEEPLIVDSEARNITFASQFMQTSENEGLLYAHVDDSFVRAYTLYADEIKKLIKD